MSQTMSSASSPIVASPSSSRYPTSAPAEVEAGSSTSSNAAFEEWRSSLAQFTGLGLSPEEKAQRAERIEHKKLESDWNRCEGWKNDLMSNSPAVVFMLKHLSLSSCPFTSTSIQCHPCPPTRSGGFSPEHGILLCQDRFFSKRHMEDTLTHELVHAYDHCKFDVKWDDLRHHACSEIRAANLSGDCRWTREIKRGFHAFSKQHQACVKRRAILSVRSNPSCAHDPSLAERAVNEVWESCWKDTRPFDEIY